MIHQFLDFILYFGPVLAGHVKKGAFRDLGTAVLGKRIGDDARDDQRLGHRREFHGEGQLAGAPHRQARVLQPQHGLSRVGGQEGHVGIDGHGLDAGGGQLRQPPLQNAARHDGNRGSAGGTTLAQRKHQVVDVLGQLFLESERDGARQLHAAAGGKLWLRQQDLRGGRNHDNARRPRNSPRKAQGTTLSRRRGYARLVDAQPLGVFLAGGGQA